jgi:glucuronokinase
MTAVQRGLGVALARAALAGNPSDGYGGAVLAVTLPGWQARAQAAPARTLIVEPASALVEATVERYARELESAGLKTAIRWNTSIPQRVGLGSSSALVIAVLRALCGLHGVEMDAAELAELALAVETEEMGIIAGLQDRVTQAYGGLVFMDFTERAAPSYAQLDESLLPPLLVAWRAEAACDSGDVHATLHARHRRGESKVRVAMALLATAARGARDALLSGDVDGFGKRVDETFDLRRELLPLDPRCVEMVEAARAAGASANYTGSGGAIVAVCASEEHRDEVERSLAAKRCGVAWV